MVTRDERLADFRPLAEAPGQGPLRLLCEDHVGSYVVPFPCIHRDGAWLNAATGQPIEAEVIGWRDFSRR